MARSIRVETYIPPQLDDKLDEQTDNKSKFIREAIRRELQRCKQEEYTHE